MRTIHPSYPDFGAAQSIVDSGSFLTCASSRLMTLRGERLCKPLAITSLASRLFLFKTYLLGYMYCVIEADFFIAVKLYKCILNLLNKMPPDIALGAHLVQTSEV